MYIPTNFTNDNTHNTRILFWSGDRYSVVGLYNTSMLYDEINKLKLLITYLGSASSIHTYYFIKIHFLY